MTKTTRPPLSEDYGERSRDSSLTLFQKLYGRYEEDILDDMLAAMRKYGVHRFEGDYSGGHDEGGLQEVDVLTDGAGNDVEIDGIDSYDHELRRCADELLSTKFFSWALDCSVYGRLIVDMNERRAWTSGQQEETRYIDDPDPLEVTW
jgi:hypothetical protein